MFNVTISSCPYENWTSVASTSCDNPNHFHCLKDEYGRLGWVCAEPIWVEEDRCPVFNAFAKKLDTIHCPQKKCPPYNYRSNEVNVEYACRYKSSTESSTPSVKLNGPKESISMAVVIMIVIVGFLIAAAVLAGIVFFIRRRKLSSNSHAQLEIAPKPEETTEKSTLLIQEVDTNKAEKPSESFFQARNDLKKYNWVVITGVQGAGKTYLAKSLVEDLEMKEREKERKIEIVWISNLSKLHGENEKMKSQGEVFIFDEIFYESQMELPFAETFESLKSFLQMCENKKVIITIPSYIWQVHNKMFSESKFDEVHINLDTITDSVKRCILQNLMRRYKVSGQEAENLCSYECKLLKQKASAIGFPALISWLCKTSSEESVLKQMADPLSRMSDRIEKMKKEEIGKYLTLSYMALEKGTLDINNIDKDVLNYLKRKNYAPEICHSDLQGYAKRMVGEYLLEIKDGIFNFDLNIIKKIVLVNIAKDNAVFLQDHCKKDYLRYIIPRDKCPSKLAEVYSQCFTTI